MNQKLNLEPNLSRPDDFYQLLIDMHRDLSEADSQRANAKLILLLSNHIGDLEVLKEAMAIAKGDSCALPGIDKRSHVSLD
jgi:hypothetical protein